MMILLIFGHSNLQSSETKDHFTEKFSTKISALDEKQRKQLFEGELLLTTTPDTSSPWPVVHIYALLETPPSEAFAIFAHFEHQKHYIPNLLKSKVIDFQGPSQIDVSYELKLPWPLSNSRYSHRHVLEDNHMTWTLIESNSTDAVEGMVRFVPISKQDSTEALPYQSMLVYQNRVTPKSSFAGIFRNAMIRDVENSLKATLEEIEEVWINRPKLLKESVEILNQTLKGDNPYR